MTLGRTLRSQSGYSLIELLISTAIMLVVTGAIFGLVNPSQGTAKVQPEVADLQQRLRVASDTLFRELMMSGAGVYQGLKVRAPPGNQDGGLQPRHGRSPSLWLGPLIASSCRRKC